MNLMGRQMNLPQIQRILQEFEKESSTMDMKEEMMSDSIDDVMEDEGEGEEEEGDRILDEVLAEIGISVGQQVRLFRSLVWSGADECSWARHRRRRRWRAWRNRDSGRRSRWGREGGARREEERWMRCRRGWITCGRIRGYVYC